MLDRSSGCLKKETTRTECLDKANFTLDQEALLGRSSTQRQEVHLVLILTQEVTMLIPIRLGFDLTVLFDWLVLKELAHRKRRKRPLCQTI